MDTECPSCRGGVRRQNSQLRLLRLLLVQQIYSLACDMFYGSRRGRVINIQANQLMLAFTWFGLLVPQGHCLYVVK